MENKALLIVEDEAITEKDIKRIIEKYPLNKRIYFETDQGKEQLLEQKMAFLLMSRYAKELNIDQTEEYMTSLKELSEQLLTQIVIECMFAGIEVNEQEVLKIYENNKVQFQENESIVARHILVNKEEEAKKIRKQILNKKLSFEEAAMQYSICPSKEKGGSLGVVQRGMMVREFEQVAFTLNIGELSQAVKTQFGYHLVIVDEKTDAVQKEFDEVKEHIIQHLREQMQQKLYEEKIIHLKEKYKVRKL